MLPRTSSFKFSARSHTSPEGRGSGSVRSDDFAALCPENSDRRLLLPFPLPASAAQGTRATMSAVMSGSERRMGDGRLGRSDDRSQQKFGLVSTLCEKTVSAHH